MDYIWTVNGKEVNIGCYLVTTTLIDVTYDNA